MKEQLFRAAFTDGEPVGDPEALVRIVTDAGVDAEQVRAVLESDRYTDEVRQHQPPDLPRRP